MEQKEFLEKVHGLLTLADGRGGSITEAMMEEPFAGENLDADQILSLRSYLKANGVAIVSDEEDAAASGKVVKMTSVRGAGRMESQEKKIYKSYLAEMELLQTYAPEEEAALFARKISGDRDARQRLVEGNLKRVVELAGNFAGRGVPLTDLVQEGNMELLLLVDEHSGTGFQEDMEIRIAAAMQMLVEEYSGNDSFKNRMADLANKLMDASEEYAEDMGEQPTIEDLAKILHVRPDEVETVMKMSMNAMTMDETGFGGE
ncbi:MAG: sigma-70 domain-containing protein [Lachnospiraceae bacterium]|nr:sigma-70 domain-containing protein [Lachnospiraceae bacterium]MDY4970188.1 sigma-70 domain-containing protein [Lachnospiraceae bacterium]